ncbi:phage minor capsid protein, partial [Clostridioides difficile]
SLDLAQFQVSTGVLDYKTAVKKAVKRLADSGLRFIDYETGWTNRIDVATRRAVLTGVNQMSQNINNKVINDLDTDIVEVTAHSGARCEG